MSRLAMIYADFHLHTTCSPDSSIAPKTLVDQLHTHPFIKTIAVTDHNTLEGYFQVKQLASSYEDLLIIPGVEVATHNGDLILLGITELPLKPWTVTNVIDFAKDKDATIIVPHPYRAHGLGDHARECSADAIETLNAISPQEANKLAENLAKEMRLPRVAGSDAHSPNELWTAYNEIRASQEIDEILKAVRKGFVEIKSLNRRVYI
jgi:predicted metal-dependent phosphoesterase TrpH